jgi:acetyl esterase/lipase
VVVGGAEALLDDSVRLARSACMAGVDVTLYIGAGMQHIFPIYCGVIPESDAAVAMIGAWIRSRTSPESEQATHNGKEDPVPGQDSEEASPT